MKEITLKSENLFSFINKKRGRKQIVLCDHECKVSIPQKEWDILVAWYVNLVFHEMTGGDA